MGQENCLSPSLLQGSFEELLKNCQAITVQTILSIDQSDAGLKNETNTADGDNDTNSQKLKTQSSATPFDSFQA